VLVGASIHVSINMSIASVFKHVKDLGRKWGQLVSELQTAILIQLHILLDCYITMATVRCILDTVCVRVCVWLCPPVPMSHRML